MTVVVAFSRPETAQRFAGALEAEGLSVLRVCTAGAQALRALEPCEDAVLVCGARLPDRTADELARDLDGRAAVLVAARPERLALCEEPSLHRLALPASGAQLAGAVRAIVRRQNRPAPRTADEGRLIDEAKRALMARGMTEAEAHRFLQRESMRLGVRMAVCAQLTLETERS